MAPKSQKRPRRPSSSAADLLSSALSLPHNKSLKSSLSSLLSRLPPTETLDFSHHLLASIKSHLKSPLNSPTSPPSKKPKPPETQNPDFDKLQTLALLLNLCITHPDIPFDPAHLLPSAQALHDSLVNFENDPQLLSLVATLSEDWYRRELPGRDSLVSQSIPFLLSKALTEGKKTDVRRIYSLKDAFLLFDYEDGSTEDLRMLLVRCVITPVFLKVEEGRKFVGFLLGLSGQLVRESLAVVKSQIVFGRKSVLEAYAEILFRGWKGAEGGIRGEVEGFLQVMVEGAIYASEKSLAGFVRRVLRGFVEQRSTEGVEKLLFRLVEPVLFRSLQVANSNVRQNALHLLLDMFPLEDPDMTKEDKDTLLDKQFFLLEKLLLDECLEVRTVAVEGCYRILTLFWEVIPSLMITKFLAKTVEVMSHDSCYEVRLSTISGIIYLVDNPQSHEIIKVLLPKLGFMFSDPILSVRLAFFDLLLAVRDLRSFQFIKVVSLDALLKALANDHPRVARKITKLLIPSYFPSKLASKEACSRCIALIKRSPDAGAKFCEFILSEGSSSKSLLELARMCISLALSPKGLTHEQIDGLLVASSNLVQSLNLELVNKEVLSKLFSAEKLNRLLVAAVSEHAQTAVLTIASVLPAVCLSELQDKCMEIVRNSAELYNNKERQGLVEAAHKLIHSCGWFNEMFEFLTNTLQSAVSKFGFGRKQEDMPSSKKKRVKLSMRSSSKKDQASAKTQGSPNISSTCQGFTAAAVAAWQVKMLVTSEATRKTVLKSPFSEMAFSALDAISQFCIQHSLQWEVMDISPVLAYTSYATYLSLHSSNLNADDSSCKDADMGSQSLFPETILSDTINRLLDCVDKLFMSASGKLTQDFESEQSRQKKVLEGMPSSSEDGDVVADSLEVKRVCNMVKLLTSILKFVVDAVSLNSAECNHVRCLTFASIFIKQTVSSLRRLQNQISNEEEAAKNITMHLKSSFTYAAKLLHLALLSSNETSPPPPEAFYLANGLLDLISSVTLYLGPRHPSGIFSVVNQWLPTIVLGLGCYMLIKLEPETTPELPDLSGDNFPAWLSILGKKELSELGDLSHDNDNELPKMVHTVLNNLIEMVLPLLKKGSYKLLDAVGCIILAGVQIALEKEQFDLVLGLVHFVCAKLLANKPLEFEELEMFSTLKVIYLHIEEDLANNSSPNFSEDASHQLQSAKSKIKSLLYSG